MKIKKIEKIENQTTYCMNVEKYHNFLIPIGNKYVISKNCWGINTPSRWGCFDTETYIQAEDFIKIILEDGSIIELKSDQQISTKRGLICVRDLNENDEIENLTPSV